MLRKQSPNLNFDDIICISALSMEFSKISRIKWKLHLLVCVYLIGTCMLASEMVQYCHNDLWPTRYCYQRRKFGHSMQRCCLTRLTQMVSQNTANGDYYTSLIHFSHHSYVKGTKYIVADCSQRVARIFALVVKEFAAETFPIFFSSRLSTSWRYHVDKQTIFP